MNSREKIMEATRQAMQEWKEAHAGEEFVDMDARLEYINRRVCELTNEETREAAEKGEDVTEETETEETTATAEEQTTDTEEEEEEQTMNTNTKTNEQEHAFWFRKGYNDACEYDIKYGTKEAFMILSDYIKAVTVQNSWDECEFALVEGMLTYLEAQKIPQEA